MRIVSLLPSATEILHAVGAGEQVVGVTFECDSPPHAREAARIVSTSALPEGLTPAEIDAAVRRLIGAGEDIYRLDRSALRERQKSRRVSRYWSFHSTKGGGNSPTR